jgi:hypothetical protein
MGTAAPGTVATLDLQHSMMDVVAQCRYKEAVLYLVRWRVLPCIP